MPAAGDDEDGDLALTLRERRLAGREVLSEGRRRMHELRIVDPHLVGAGQAAPRSLDEEPVALPLRRRHLIDGKLRIASERGRGAHLDGPTSSGPGSWRWLTARTPRRTGRPALRSRRSPPWPRRPP